MCKTPGEETKQLCPVCFFIQVLSFFWQNKLTCFWSNCSWRSVLCFPVTLFNWSQWPTLANKAPVLHVCVCTHTHSLVKPLPHTAAALDSVGSNNSCLWEGKNLQMDGSLSLKGPFSPEGPIMMEFPARPGWGRACGEPVQAATSVDGLHYGLWRTRAKFTGSSCFGSKGKLDWKWTWAHLCPQLSSWAQLEPPKRPSFLPHPLPVPSIPKPP